MPGPASSRARSRSNPMAGPIAAMAVFVHSGQICIAGSRLFVAREIHDEFVRRVAEFAGRLRIGHGIEADTEIGPLINARQADKVAGYIKAGNEEGARLVAGGSRLEGTVYDGGNFIAPTVFGSVSDQMTIAREEIFGPVVGLSAVSDLPRNRRTCRFLV